MTDETEFFQRKIASAENTASRIQVLNTASKAIQASNPTQALQWADEAMSLATVLGNSHHIAECLFNLGTSSNALARYRNAITFFEQARARYQELGNDIHAINATGNIGLAYSKLADYSAALDSYHQALEQAEAIGNQTLIGRLLNSVGSTYLHLNDYALALDYCTRSLHLRESTGDTNVGPVLTNLANIHLYLDHADIALDYYNKSLQLCIETSNSYGRGLTLVNIAEVYLHRRDYKIALQHQFEALEIFTAACNQEMRARVLSNIGTAYQEQGDLDTALDYQLQAVAIAEQIEQRRTYASALARVGTIYQLTGRIDEAKTTLVAALELATAIKVRSLQITIHEVLAQAYEDSGEPEKSLEHLRKVMRMGEEELAREQKQVLEETNMRFEVEKVRREKELYRLRNVELAGALREVEQLNAHLQEINNEKTELLGIVTHELRNPLTGILASVTLMKDYIKRMSKEDITNQLIKIEETVHRSSSTIDHLLDINAIEAGRLTLVLRPVSVCSVARQIVNLYDERAALKHLSLHFQCSADNSTISADEKTLFDVIDNLVSNAVKYSPPHTHITVSVERQEANVRILVHDEGPGLTYDDRKKLFGKFQRLSARPTGGESSTGLGLYIARQIVELHGGTIHAESEPGRGSTFIVELPTSYVPASVLA